MKRTNRTLNFYLTVGEMNDKDFKQIADFLKIAVGRCNDGIDACERGDVDQLCTALIYAHETLHDALNDFTAATRRKQNEPNAG